MIDEPDAAVNVPALKSRSAPAAAVSVAAPEIVPPPWKLSVPDGGLDRAGVGERDLDRVLVPVPPVLDSVPALISVPPPVLVADADVGEERQAGAGLVVEGRRPRNVDP